jgi:hypothetical protein
VSKWSDWLTADWLTAFGTCGAVIVSLWIAGREARKRRKLEERQQAEQVTAWFVRNEEEQEGDKIYRGLCVRNASNQMVYDVIAQVVSLQGSFRKSAVSDTRNTEFAALVGNVPPGETLSRINYGGGGMHKRFGIELAFQDAANRYWLRHGNGMLKKMNRHPIDLYKIDRPVSWEN